MSTTSNEPVSSRTRLLHRKRSDLQSWTKTSLEVLKELAPLCKNVPCLGPLSAVAIKLIEITERLDNNEKDLRRLARKAADIIVKTMNPFRGHTSDDIERTQKLSLENDIDTLRISLKDILEFTDSTSKASKLQRLMTLKSDRSKVDDLNKDLDAAVVLFQIGSSISLRVTAALINQTSDIPKSEASLYEPSIPARPVLLEGRDAETLEIANILSETRGSNVCILGSGGMGKTTVALGVLHHPSIAELCGRRRYFIPCDAATSADTLLSTITSHFSIENNIDAVIVRLQPSDPGERGLLLLDNFESPWDTGSRQSAVEKLLTALTSINSLHVLITLRGDVTPANTEWSPTSFRQLSPLRLEDSLRLFSKISGRKESEELLEELLKELDHVPLAIVLMGQIAKVEVPLSMILQQWRSKKTKYLAKRGTDRLTNLEVSIEISLSSPQMSDSPSAIVILAVLSLLPTGIPTAEVPQVLPLFDEDAINEAVMVLVSLSLLQSSDGRFRILAPIRAHIMLHHPVDVDNLRALGEYYFGCIETRNYGEKILDARSINQELGNINAAFSHLLAASLCVGRVMVAVHCLYDIMYRFRETSLDILELCLAAGSCVEHHTSLQAIWFAGSSLKRNAARTTDPDQSVKVDDKSKSECLKDRCAEIYVSLAVDYAFLTHMLRNLSAGEKGEEDSVQLFEKAEKLANSANLPVKACHALRGNAECQSKLMRRDVAKGLLMNALDLCNQHSDKQVKVRTMVSLAVLPSPERTTSMKKADLLVALKLSSELQGKSVLHREARAKCLLFLVWATWAEGSYDESEGYYHEASELYDGLGHAYNHTRLLYLKAQILQYRGGHDEEAYHAFCQVLEIATKRGFGRTVIDCLDSLATTKGEEGEWADSQRLFQQALDKCRSMEVKDKPASILYRIATHYMILGNLEASVGRDPVTWYSVAITKFKEGRSILNDRGFTKFANGYTKQIEAATILINQLSTASDTSPGIGDRNFRRIAEEEVRVEAMELLEGWTVLERERRRQIALTEQESEPQNQS